MTAVAYYRTSSAANVGEDKDSRKRQEDAVQAYAARQGVQIVGSYYDAAVKGSDDLMDRPGFSALLEYISGNGARTILVETANRFARDVVVQITGYEYLKKLGIMIVPVDAPQHFLEDTPSAEMIRGIFAVISKFEKRSLVEKMKKARDRKRRERGRCEGRYPAPKAAVEIARALRAEGVSLRDIAEVLANRGFTVVETVNGVDSDGKMTKTRVSTGKQYKAQSVKYMLNYKDIKNDF